MGSHGPARLEARPPWAVAAQGGQIVTSTKEYDWTSCSGGPGDASGRSERARGRLLRPAGGRGGRHANLRFSGAGKGKGEVEQDIRPEVIGNPSLTNNTIQLCRAVL